ncbi:hypothetical protein SRRS_15110 [Sporomusa rhizae]|uniref:OmpH family outer membrane protein n=1 Tax=Sporomusa rhizae TaxID=357999 RepID=UPI00352BB286
MKKIIVSFIVVTLMAIGTALAAEPSMEMNRIGVIDINTVMMQSPLGRECQRQLKEKGKELGDQLEADKANLSKDEYQKKHDEAYGTFLKLKRDLEEQLEVKVKEAMFKVTREKNLIIILYKGSVAFGGIDVTQDVINSME